MTLQDSCLEQVTSWGRVKRQRVPVAHPRFRDEIATMLHRSKGAQLAVGLKRSYGDSGLNGAGGIIDMTGLDRIISFDTEHGLLRAEAGLSLGDLIRQVVPHGFFPTTVPGTRVVTLGGAVANDVHGKNHHEAGTFGCSVRGLQVVRSDIGQLEIGPDCNHGLFAATVGGLGLTGVITAVEVALQRISSAYLDVETVPFSGFSEFMELSRESAGAYAHTVAWIDCTTGGVATRGLFSRGNFRDDGVLTPHSAAQGAALPVDLPQFAINPLSLRAFNALYYHAGTRKKGPQRVHYAPFLFPLDAVGNWNRAYGRAGFYQYQCVVPFGAAEGAIPDLLDVIARSGMGSCLAVLKTFGSRPSPGMLSFPIEGVTLALDFPNRRGRTLKLFDRLDRIVAAAKGRLYPAKDGRMTAALFYQGYPAWNAFSPHIDPKMESDFSRRMRQ